MKRYLLGLNDQIGDALRIGKLFRHPVTKRKISQIIFCGMGGSGIGGDILRRLAFRADRVPFMVNRSTAMPRWVDPQTLVIVSSYSGGTREILESFERARRSRAPILVVTSGGRLEELARAGRFPVLKVPQGFPPRCAIGYLTFVLVPVLNRLGILNVRDAEIRATRAILAKISEKRALGIARRLAGRFVHLYAVSGLMEPVLVRWRSQLAENAKTLVSHQMLPEMFHNEIEGWQAPRELVRRSTAVFFSDPEDPLWIRERARRARRMIAGTGAKVLEIRSEGRSPLARIFSLIALGDWVSYELARLYRVDPLVIDHIDALKKTATLGR
jgi:glucose/mannose-6-phosphate isomerase